MINFNSITGINSPSGNDKGNGNNKYRLLSEDNHKLKIGQNNVNSIYHKHNLMNNILFNKKSQRVNIINNKEKNFKNSIKDDLSSEKDKFKIPVINIKK